MAFSMGGDNGSGLGRRRRYGGSTLSEMNVVPLVDVVLVLLIIFMLTAQAMQFGLEIEVPKVKTEKQSAQDLQVVNVTKEGELYLNEKPINVNDLGQTILASEKKGKKTQVFVRADRNAKWDVIAKVIAALTESNLAIQVVTQTDDSAGRR